MTSIRLKQLRKKYGYTQEALASQIGTSKHNISMWETQDREPSVRYLKSMALLFHVSIDYLIGKNNDQNSSPLPEGKGKTAPADYESAYKETVLKFLSLDFFGKSAVKNLIDEEYMRCEFEETLNCEKYDFHLTEKEQAKNFSGN